MDRWAEAIDVARAVAPAAAWRAELARRLNAAADGCFATVLTCAPGDWLRLRHDTDPHDLGHVVERIGREYVPRIERAGEGWQYAIRAHGPVYAPIETARCRPLAGELREEILSPAGIKGYVTAFFIAGDPPRILGLTAIGAGDGSEKLLARAAGPLHEVAKAAAQTLSAALALAEGCFAQAGRCATMKKLTAREKQIAALSAQGFANVNVAAQLGISETTVAVHLRNIYAKLGVHSRVELASAVLG